MLDTPDLSDFELDLLSDSSAFDFSKMKLQDRADVPINPNLRGVVDMGR